jgi:hypothetical protein
MKNCENIHLVLSFRLLTDPRTDRLQRNVLKIVYVTYTLLTMVVQSNIAKIHKGLFPFSQTLKKTTFPKLSASILTSI